MVVWYDVAKQNATNESMQANPVLKDLSGNRRDATCYNFVWAGMSGIGGYLPTNNAFNNPNNTTGIATIEGNKVHITHTPDIVCAAYNNGLCAPGETRPETSFKVTGLTGTGLVLKVSAIYGFPNEITQDGIYTYPEFTNTTQQNLYNDLVFDETSLDVACDIIIEQLPQYPGALVYDGVDDYAMYTQSLEDVQFPGYTMIYKAIVFRDKQYGSHFALSGKGVQIATVGNYLASKVERNASYGERTDFPEKPEYYHTVRTVYQSTYSFDGIQELGVSEEHIPAVGTDHDGIRLGSALNSGSVSKIVLYSFILFDRDLTDEEIDWVKTNLIEQ